MSTLLEKFGITIDFYDFLIAWALVFTRIFVLLIITPFLGGRGVPGRVRFVTSFVLSIYVFILLKDSLLSNLPQSKGILFALFFKEIFLGLAIGVTSIMCFYAIEAAGRIVDNQRGSANAQIFLPALGQVSIFGLFQFWLGLALFLFLGGHTVFLRAVLQGYVDVPVTSLPQIAPGISPFLELMVRMSADVLILGVQLAAPVLIAIFLTDLVLGIANKMAPQIPVFEIGFMMKGYVGVVMVFLSIMVLARQMDVFFGVMQDNVVRVFKYFAT